MPVDSYIKETITKVFLWRGVSLRESTTSISLLIRSDIYLVLQMKWIYDPPDTHYFGKWHSRRAAARRRDMKREVVKMEEKVFGFSERHQRNWWTKGTDSITSEVFFQHVWAVQNKQFSRLSTGNFHYKNLSRSDSGRHWARSEKSRAIRGGVGGLFAFWLGPAFHLGVLGVAHSPSQTLNSNKMVVWPGRLMKHTGCRGYLCMTRLERDTGRLSVLSPHSGPISRIYIRI